jgi:hypothetical protein
MAPCSPCRSCAVSKLRPDSSPSNLSLRPFCTSDRCTLDLATPFSRAPPTISAASSGAQCLLACQQVATRYEAPRTLLQRVQTCVGSLAGAKLKPRAFGLPQLSRGGLLAREGPRTAYPRGGFVVYSRFQGHKRLAQRAHQRVAGKARSMSLEASQRQGALRYATTRDPLLRYQPNNSSTMREVPP